MKAGVGAIHESPLRIHAAAPYAFILYSFCLLPFPLYLEPCTLFLIPASQSAAPYLIPASPCRPLSASPSHFFPPAIFMLSGMDRSFHMAQGPIKAAKPSMLNAQPHSGR
jgi:hypothetical protein